MSARIVRAADAPAYHPPLHTGVQARRLQGLEAGETDRFWVGLSTYPPESSADTSPTAQETVYVVLDGTLVLTVDGGEHELGGGDSVHLPRGTVRSVANRSEEPARLLVVIATPTEAA